MNISKIFMVIIISGFLSACGGLPKMFTESSDEKTIEELYEDARESLDKKQFKSAIDRYTEILSINPYGPIGEQANIDRAYAYYRDKKYDIAELECNRIIRLYPKIERIDYVYFLLGLTKFREQEGIWATIRGTNDLSKSNPSIIIEAHDAFADVVERFPSSAYAVEAAERMRYLETALAKQELNVAQFYYDQSAWVAAANRAKGIIERFSNSDAVEPALRLLVNCYTAMGLEDLAHDTQLVLDTNYKERS